ncbi:signal peptide peptidase-like 2A [Ornithodoros turicata]|uniref:signal peptide peptidase-like 2A n=1 Tax=Ornithodoros turicata TaxID=34597 RepID=UPI00313A0A82
MFLNNALSRLVQLLLVVWKIRLSQADGEYAVILAEGGAETYEFCAIYYPEFRRLPSIPHTLGFAPLLNMTTEDPCRDFKPASMRGTFLMVRDNGNCSSNQIVQNMKTVEPLGIIISTDRAKVASEKFDENTVRGTSMIVAFILESSAEAMTALENPAHPVLANMFTQQISPFDASMAVIWCFAVVTVAIGAFWSGVVKYNIYQSEVKKSNEPQEPMSSKEEPVDAGPEWLQIPLVEGSSIEVPVSVVLLFVVLMIVILMVMYFFFAYIVYFVLAAFTMSSVVSIIGVLEPIMYSFECGTAKAPKFLCACIDNGIEVRQLVVACVAVILPVVWVLYRHYSYAWVLQNFLGAIFCINMLKWLRVRNLMVITTFLVLVFFYDVFFVFITPYLTKGGESVMVHVATGGGSAETPPVSIRVPYLSTRALSVCLQGYSFMGYGDILAPGILVSYCLGFDLIFAGGYLYYLTALTFYGIGLGATYVGLYFMDGAQPALIYLVPATLIPVICLAWYRGHLREIWNGIPAPPPGENTDTPAFSSRHNVHSATPPAPRTARAGRRPEFSPYSIVDMSRVPYQYVPTHTCLPEYSVGSHRTLKIAPEKCEAPSVGDIMSQGEDRFLSRHKRHLEKLLSQTPLGDVPDCGELEGHLLYELSTVPVAEVNAYKPDVDIP